MSLMTSSSSSGLQKHGARYVVADLGSVCRNSQMMLSSHMRARYANYEVLCLHHSIRSKFAKRRALAGRTRSLPLVEHLGSRFQQSLSPQLLTVYTLERQTEKKLDSPVGRPMAAVLKIDGRSRSSLVVYSMRPGKFISQTRRRR